MPRPERPHRVTFDAPASVSDGEGGFIDTYAPLNPADWELTINAASLQDLERTTAGTVVTTATHIARGWFHPGVTTETRVTGVGKVFQVAGVKNLGEHGERMELYLEART